MNIVLVRQGTKYGPEYVHALTRQIKDVTPLASVTTLTDQALGEGWSRPLTHGWPGWWSKIELFSPEHKDLRPFLYIDLDSFVFSNLEHLDASDKFMMCEDFFGAVKANSSVMWIPDSPKPDQIWQTFIRDPNRYMAEFRKQGDQGFLGQFAEGLWTREDGITSYKAEQKAGRTGPQGAIMTFHGKPKPHETEGWPRDRWDQYAGELV